MAQATSEVTQFHDAVKRGVYPLRASAPPAAKLVRRMRERIARSRVVVKESLSP